MMTRAGHAAAAGAATIPSALALRALWAASGAAPGSIAAGLAVAAGLLAIGLVRPDAIGMGDGKLAVVIALGLTDRALLGLASGILLAAIFAGLRLARDAGSGGSAVPLAPFLALGALLVGAI